MNEVLKKLGPSKQNPILIINAPEEYKLVMKDIKSEIHNQVSTKYEFIQIFEDNLSDAHKKVKEIISALKDGGLLWFCYPKSSSKKYHSDINRGKAMEFFGPYNFESVFQISIDNDWTAMRFRNVDEIKSLKRKFAVSDKGKERIKGNK
ncbi:MAG: DUF3052 domain-containing protein [Actinobacteria bacterium]|nr:DUF3052 domain-containing protein [Actinomycetota bacterium]